MYSKRQKDNQPSPLWQLLLDGADGAGVLIVLRTLVSPGATGRSQVGGVVIEVLVLALAVVMPVEVSVVLHGPTATLTRRNGNCRYRA